MAMTLTSWPIEGNRVKLAFKPCIAALFGTLLSLCGSIALGEEARCLSCHTSGGDAPVHAIYQTRHGQIDGGGVSACVACHGSSEAHADNPTHEAPGKSFGPRWAMPATDASGVCLECHQKDQQMFWLGSVHDQEEVACTDCHNTHTNRDPVLTPDGQLDACLGCHARQQAEIRLPSRHPILEGKTACTDCHNPHGASTESALLQPSLNDNCYSCHAEKRGPYLWEHPPAAEDCSTCHKPHGSVHASLLTARGPFLCQQCHSAAFHPSQSYSGQAATSGSTNQYLLGKNCLNCHSAIHGSNHPSGARLAR
jgi:DmsE family decaheme c-type cytochrome